MNHELVATFSSQGTLPCSSMPIISSGVYNEICLSLCGHILIWLYFENLPIKNIRPKPYILIMESIIVRGNSFLSKFDLDLEV